MDLRPRRAVGDEVVGAFFEGPAASSPAAAVAAAAGLVEETTVTLRPLPVLGGMVLMWGCLRG